MTRQKAIEDKLRAMHAQFGAGNIEEINVTRTVEVGKAFTQRGYVIARRTSCLPHAREFSVETHGSGQMTVSFLGRTRVVGRTG